ncbi:MAG TPA: hypothetical protein VFK40_11510 [Nitrososphaeraceae archaeon]|jgi:hypothetical protein|nr:hypothetical protein [Nitrososphaeraceae archaeon]HET8792393.1 hypothetical protein [Nitrososphaeraceae archaeon]
MKFEFEEFSSIEDLFLYMASIAPYMKQVLPITYYKGYLLSIVPLSQVNADVLMMVYVKTEMSTGLIEFDISTKKYRNVQSIERADKNYFIIIKPKIATLVDKAITTLNSEN